MTPPKPNAVTALSPTHQAIVDGLRKQEDRNRSNVEQGGRHFADDGHALLAGQTCGTLMRAGLNAYPQEDDDGNFTDILYLEVGDLVVALRVLPQEDED